METLSQKDIQTSAVETLRIFRIFCERYRLRYYLAFGTLLGAVRHKGFIPWDDDIDILMPRPDYNYLLRHFNDTDHNRREVISKRSVPDFYLNFAKIIDRHTVMIETGQTLPIGVWIDIFPMDFLPENGPSRQWTLRSLHWLNFLIAYSELTTRKGRVWYKNLIAMLWQFVRPPKSWLNSLYEKAIADMERHTSGNDYCLLFRYFGKYGVPVRPVSFFEPSVKLEFEGELYDAPAKYDDFLQGCYDDYMTWPPEACRKSRHSYVCYWNHPKNKDQT